MSFNINVLQIFHILEILISSLMLTAQIDIFSAYFYVK